MSSRASWVLDASALLAYLHGESGAESVSETLLEGACISAVNWAETLSKLAERGQAPEAVSQRLEDEGILGSTLEIHPLDERAARRIAELRPSTRKAGLSLGDRACLALASQLKLVALTADSAWAELDLGIEVRLIR